MVGLFTHVYVYTTQKQITTKKSNLEDQIWFSEIYPMVVLLEVFLKDRTYTLHTRPLKINQTHCGLQKILSLTKYNKLILTL